LEVSVQQFQCRPDIKAITNNNSKKNNNNNDNNSNNNKNRREREVTTGVWGLIKRFQIIPLSKFPSIANNIQDLNCNSLLQGMNYKSLLDFRK
jgi:hypothetical protein